MEGWKSYMEDPAPANVLIKAANPKMSDGQIAFGIARMKALKVLGGEEKVPIGTMTEARWKASYDYLVGAGLLKASTDWKRAFSLDFMPVLSARAE
jgi:NitT/TauT family transport system substrate-binding protein